jgi:nucleotide-binding universal stress UspA family protein
MLAEQLGAELTLLHVVPLTESDRMLEQDMERAREHLESRAKPPLWLHGRSPRVRVRSGRAARTLVETATELDADLVVLGTHRKRLVGDALAGTIAERLLSELSCPVLSVRRMPSDAYRNVLLALNQSNASANAIRAAEALVLHGNTRASVVYGYQAPSEEMISLGDRKKSRAQASLRALLEQASNDPSRYDLILENAMPTLAVQQVVTRLKPDLLIVGTRGRGRWNRAVLGSIASRILSRARLDVLAVPDRFQAASEATRRIVSSASASGSESTFAGKQR